MSITPRIKGRGHTN